MEVVGCPGSHMAARDARCHLQESLKEGRDRQRNEGARGGLGSQDSPGPTGTPASRKEFALLGVGS